MKEGLLSLVFFHVSITLINQLTKKRFGNLTRLAIMIVLCTGFFAHQISQYIQGKLVGLAFVVSSYFYFD